MSICHVSVPCTDLNASEDLYSAILKPIGYKVYVKTPREVFYRGNVQLQPDLSLRYEKTDKPIGGVRITLFASSKTNVTKFYINGMAKTNNINSGATSDRSNAYIATLVDFDGNIIEAIYLKSFWFRFIRLPIPLTPPVLIAAVFLSSLYSLATDVGETWVLFVWIVLTFLVGDVIWGNFDTFTKTKRLDDAGLLNVETTLSRGKRTPYKKY